MGRIVVGNADQLGAVDRRQGADQIGAAGARPDDRHAHRGRSAAAAAASSGASVKPAEAPKNVRRAKFSHAIG